MTNFREDQMPQRPRKIVVSKFVLTEICEHTAPAAVQGMLNEHGVSVYFERAANGNSVDTVNFHLGSARFNTYPIILESTGLPWAEGNVYLLSRLIDTLTPAMSTYDSLADDLTAFLRFVYEENLDWRLFPKNKLDRPTYRYHGYLRRQIESREIAISTAKRRIRAVIAFYSWMKDENQFLPEHPCWKESDRILKFIGSNGLNIAKKVLSTDISILPTTQFDPFDGTINDGAKLKPLTAVEQQWVTEALLSIENTEMTLAHLFSLITGARIQTVLTFRVADAESLTASYSSSADDEYVRCAVGLGTGIDTKRSKRFSLHLPVWFCRVLQNYCASDRSRKRRTRSAKGDSSDNYLFLSKYGNPFYESQHDLSKFDPDSERRTLIRGQSVRKFISEAVIPYIRTKYKSDFHYQFHDLRATFGMNLTDSQLSLVERGQRSLSEVREFVKVRMAHESTTTTDNYLKFRGNLKHIQQLSDDHDKYLQKIANEIIF